LALFSLDPSFPTRLTLEQCLAALSQNKPMSNMHRIEVARDRLFFGRMRKKMIDNWGVFFRRLIDTDMKASVHEVEEEDGEHSCTCKYYQEFFAPCCHIAWKLMNMKNSKGEELGIDEFVILFSFLHLWSSLSLSLLNAHSLTHSLTPLDFRSKRYVELLRASTNIFFDRDSYVTTLGAPVVLKKVLIVSPRTKTRRILESRANEFLFLTVSVERLLFFPFSQK
jgi:hypothetical protein